MIRQCFCLPAIAILTFLQVVNSQARIYLENPSFEEPYTPGPSGCLGPVPGWFETKGVDRIGVAWERSTYNMYDNGKIPDGRQTAFLWTGYRFSPYTVSEDPNTLAQVVGIFEAGKTYIVKFHCNARANGYVSPSEQVLSLATLWVTLGDEIIDPAHNIAPSEPTGLFTKPFTEVTCKPFTPSSSGSFQLTFHSYAAVHPYDATLMIDNVRIVLATNEPPLFPTFTPRKAVAGVPFRFDAHAVDEQFQTLTYRLKSAPAGCVINEETGKINWPVTAQDLGQKTIVIQASDSGSPPLTSETTLELEVLPPPRLSIAVDDQDQTILSWTGVRGVQYQIVRGPEIDGDSWTPQATLTGTDGLMSWSEPVDNGAFFYQLILSPAPGD